PGAAEATGGDAAADADAADGSDQTVGRARRAAAGLTVNDALRLLSGPGGLASKLRGQLTGPAATISLPLDVGAAADIPAHLRRAITRRDHHCRFPGCDQPAIACHVHHLRRRADGGDTSIANCCLLCPFHHLIAIHRWGWQLTLNPDGTTTAVSPDRQRTLHSHAPPTAA
ncbi:MAG TPA: HNH endonuclease signature motif containing protein, partial [Streptosporangiaceae bacterium]|nr:HNH endonuclease signature motif containing protein [Streptosporangiaceae bacterium]